MNIQTLYQLCLQLYPADFRNEFGDEMLDTFAEQLSNCPQDWRKARLFISELSDHVRSAFTCHIDTYKQHYTLLTEELKTVYQARWIVRTASLFNILFFVLVSLQSYLTSPTAELLVMPILFSIQLVSVLFALKWERAGGIIMLTATLTIAPIILFSTALPGLEWIAIFASVLWTLPFAGFATAYLMIGQRQMQIQRQMLS